jgi:hypothetical protein
METMNKDRDLLVGVGGVYLTRTPSAMPTTASGSEFQTIPLKLTLMGLPNDIPRISSFREAALSFVKGMLSLIANDIDGLKITDAKERYIDSVFDRRRDLAPAVRSVFSMSDYNYSISGIEEGIGEDHHRIFNLYYDVVAVVPDPSRLYGPLLIDAAHNRHSEILQQIQEYKPTQYYYAEDFDVCTTASGKMIYDDALFDMCTKDHQIVPVKFGVLALPKDIDRDIFKEELIMIYKDLLTGDLQMTGFYGNRIEEAGKNTDFYFDINVIQNNRDMDLVIGSKVNSQEGRGEILNRIQSYTNDEGRSIQWCITETGRYSTEPCTTTKASSQTMPTWAIVTISMICVLVVLALLLWRCIVVYQRDQEEEEFRVNCRKYIADPEDFYRSTGRLDKPRRGDPPRMRHDRRHHDRVYARRPQKHRRRRDQRHRHHDDRRNHRCYRSKWDNKVYHDSVDSDLHDTVRTLPDNDNEYQMVLYEEPAPPQYPRRELLQLPPPPQDQLLRIEADPRDQYLARQKDLLQIEAQHPMQALQTRALVPRPPPGHQEMLQIEDQYPPQRNLQQQPHHPTLNPNGQSQPPPQQFQRPNSPVPRPPPGHQEVLQIEDQYPPQRNLQQQPHHPTLNPRRQSQLSPQQFQRPHSPPYPHRQSQPLPQQAVVHPAQGPVYCDDELVNRPDPPEFKQRRR